MSGSSASLGTLSVVSVLSRPLVIAIDGPSGSGKSSTAKGVAARLQLDFLDTGAMYRAATWLVLRARADVDQTDAVADLVRRSELVISLDPHAATVAVDGHDVTAAIREPAVSAAVSKVAGNLQVRQHLIGIQRTLIAGSRRGIVAEGRDITTVVAPDADLRLLLVADPSTRVARRHAELGDGVRSDDVTDQVLRRDRDDAGVTQFEQPAPGVRMVDSTTLSLDEVIALICGMVAQHPAADQPVGVNQRMQVRP